MSQNMTCQWKNGLRGHFPVVLLQQVKPEPIHCEANLGKGTNVLHWNFTERMLTRRNSSGDLKIPARLVKRRLDSDGV
jgi:hypothetical protein